MNDTFSLPSLFEKKGGSFPPKIKISEDKKKLLFWSIAARKVNTSTEPTLYLSYVFYDVKAIIYYKLYNRLLIEDLLQDTPFAYEFFLKTHINLLPFKHHWNNNGLHPAHT